MTLAHQVDGAGEPVVLLNGGMMTIAGWQPVAEALIPDFRVVRCDFRGQLQTLGRAPAELPAHAADVVELLDELALSAVHLVGASFGALVAVDLAARYPERVRSLVAVTASARASTTMSADTRALRQLVAAAAAGGDRRVAIDHLMERIFSPAFQQQRGNDLETRSASSASLPASWFEGLDGILAAVIEYDLREVARRVEAPALVVGAARDEVMTPAGVAELAAALRAPVVEHPESGHALVVEDPRWLAERCREFLQSQQRSRR